MALSSEQFISRYNSQIARNNKFSSDLVVNLPFYQRGMLSPKELLGTMLADFGAAEAFVITPTQTNEFPIDNTLVVRRVPNQSSSHIEIDDPFSSPDRFYLSLIIGADHNELYSVKGRRQDVLGSLPSRKLNLNKSEDNADATALIYWFETSKVLE